MPVTLAVIGASQLLALAIALPVGIYSAVRPYSWFDRIASSLAFVGFSLPTFFTGILLILIFSIKLDWLPFVFRADLSTTGWAGGARCSASRSCRSPCSDCSRRASWTRYVRSAMLDVIRLDYVTTARAKGLAERVVIMKHVVRNALIPVVTLVALQMPAIFGGAIVTEQIFRIPGIGSLLIDRDPAQRHAGDHGGDLRVLLPCDHLQPDRRPALWLARPSHLLPLARSSRARRGALAVARGAGGASGATGWRTRACSCW